MTDSIPCKHESHENTIEIIATHIYYLFQEKFKNPKIIEIQQVHQIISTKHD